jgi:lysophospholipase L1-like esterase
MAAGLAEVSSLATDGLLRRVVIVGLGTNGTVTSGQIRNLLAEIGPARKLVLVNTYEARPWEHADNSVIGAAARKYPNVLLANWHATIAHRTSLLWGDGVHPRPSGARLYAKVVAAAAQAAASVPSAAPTRAAAGPSAGPGPATGGTGGQSPTPGSSAGHSGPTAG